MCAFMSKPYGWDLRKNAESSFKKHKKTIFGLFIFLQTVHAIETTFYSHSTSYYGTMCAIRSKPYGWNLRKKDKISSKNTKKNIFGLFLFPQKLCRRLKRLFTVTLLHIRAPCVQLCQNRMAGI